MAIADEADNAHEADTAVSPEGRGTTSAMRVTDVLIFLLENGGTGSISEISRTLGISKTVVYRILQSFLSRDLVELNLATREYRLGPTAAALGVLAADPFEQADLQAAAMPHIQRLSEITRETSTVSALVGNYCVHIDQVVSNHEIRMILKTRHPRPLAVGASSRAILAFMNQEQQEHVLDHAIPRLTPGTLADLDVLLRELEVTRKTGVAVSFGEREVGSAAIASPVWKDNDLVGAVSVCGPSVRFTPEAVAANSGHVRDTAQQVTRALHHAGPAARPATRKGSDVSR